MPHQLMHIVAYNTDGRSFDLMIEGSQIAAWLNSRKNPKMWWVRIADQTGKRVGYKEEGQETITWETPFPP